MLAEDPLGEKAIERQCACLNEILRSLSSPLPESIRRLRRIKERIKMAERIAGSRPEEARNLLRGVIQELQVEPDGAGGYILGKERYDEFLRCQDRE